MMLQYGLLVMYVVTTCNGFSSHFHKLKVEFDEENSSQFQNVDPGDPLYLTPYILNGDIEHGKMLSMSKEFGQTSYSGFFTVNMEFGCNMYFIFFPSQDGNQSAPLLLWLQGGPGGSSLFGLFNEHGPLEVDGNGMPLSRKITWNSVYHLLYIDNPVGTGYSFCSVNNGFSKTESEVAENLYSALTQFFVVYSEYQDNDFYITGESYAGKYIPAIGYKIHTANMNNPTLKINLQGLAIGDGLCDPENMYGALPDMAYNFGLVDEMQRSFVLSQIKIMTNYIQSKEFMKAFEIFDMLLNGDIYPYPTYFFNVTGSTDYFNILRQENPPEFNYYLKYINKPNIRAAMKVGKMPYGLQSETVEKALIEDIMDTVKDWLAVLMENYKVMLYNGQLDVIVGAPLTERFLSVLSWSGNQQYLNASRTVWKNGDDVAGYIRSVGKFSQVIIRGGGHLIPYDQPERTFNLLKMFVNNAL